MIHFIFSIIFYTFLTLASATMGRGRVEGNGENGMPAVRPEYTKRTFHSMAIDELIEQLTPMFINSNLSTLFSNCLPNTLDTTVLYFTQDPLDSFVITGDIEALWLRDSMNQVLPYIPYASEDTELASLIHGLINRQANSILIDSFANAFNYNASNQGHQDDIRKPPMTPAVFEGKYEIDSLNAFMKLSYWYWYYTKDLSFVDNNWIQALEKTASTIRTMQEDNGASKDPPYLFQRYTAVATDTLMMSGRGPPAKTNGLSRSLFRPSDDAVTLPYNVPGNAMACTELRHIQKMLTGSGLKSSSHRDMDALIAKLETISSGICQELENLISSAAENGKPLPYEIDGFGSSYYMDDANVPSLLSLPTLGYINPSNAVYQATRNFVLSESNPFYFTGVQAEGIGGPHVGYNFAWPMAIIQRAMTSEDTTDINNALNLLIESAYRTGLMHESFNVNNVNDYTRSWFAWANGMYGELILQIIEVHPELVIKEDSIAAAQELVKTPISLAAQENPVVA